MAAALKRILTAGAVLAVFLSAGAPLGAQTIGPDLLIPGTDMPPAGSLRFAAQLSFYGAWSYYSVSDGRSELTDSLGGEMGAMAAGLEMVYSLSPAAAAFVSWAPGGSFASRFSADEKRRASGFWPLHAGIWLKLTGSEGLLRAPAAVDSAAALVLAVPFGWPDYERELERRNDGLVYNPENSGVRAWGLGYLLETEWRAAARPHRFSLWAAHDLLVFLPAAYDTAGLREFEENRIWGLLENSEPFDTIWYRYQLGLYLAPRLNLRGFDDALWRVALPFSFRYRPAPIFDGEVAVADTEEWELTAGITAAIVLPGVTRHWEFVVGYDAPLAGRNLRALHQLRLGLAVDLIARGYRTY